MAWFRTVSCGFVVCGLTLSNVKTSLRAPDLKAETDNECPSLPRSQRGSETVLTEIKLKKGESVEKALRRLKKKIDREEMEFTVVVDKKPARAGIDPYNKLIDRRPKDNTIVVDIP